MDERCVTVVHMAEFDRPYWEQHWQHAHGNAIGPNPYLADEIGDLAPGTALDAGCGAGSEAIWLAEQGWQVLAVDISAEALAHTDRAMKVEWLRADLTTWAPDERFDLVMTHYAHPQMPQLAFYERIAEWVAPGGTLLVVGHRPPAEASATLADVIALLDAVDWQLDTAEERVRTLSAPKGRPVTLHDIVVRATRRADRSG